MPQPDELDFPSISAAEQERERLIQANLTINYKLTLDKLDDGEPRGTDRWNEWADRAKKKYRENQFRIRAIKIWLKDANRRAGLCSEFDTLAQEARKAVYALIDHCKALRLENEELKRSSPVLADDHVSAQ